MVVFCVRSGVILSNFQNRTQQDDLRRHREALDSRVNPNEADGRRVEREVIEQEEKADTSNDVIAMARADNNSGNERCRARALSLADVEPYGLV